MLAEVEMEWEGREEGETDWLIEGEAEDEGLSSGGCECSCRSCSSNKRTKSIENIEKRQ